MAPWQPARWRAPASALLLIVVVVGSLWARAKVEPLTVFDQPFYLGIAHDIRHFGRFTDGYVFGETLPDGTRPAGMRFAPLYPAMLAAAARLDPGFGGAMDCVVDTRGEGFACPDDATLVRAVQAAMLVATYFLVWLMARAIGRSERVAWMALLLALITAPLPIRYADYAMTETTSVFLFTAATAAALAALRAARWIALAGLLLGLTALTRPAFFYLCLVAGSLGLGAALRRPSGGRSLMLAGVFVLGMALPVGPWILRNALVVGHAGLTRGYDSHTLVQRLSFDAMSWREYGLSYLCWLPGGTGLADAMSGPRSCARFAWDERPDTFYAIGTGALMRDTVAAAGGWDRHLGYLIRTYVLADPVKYALVTIPLALRGAWIDHLWGLILMPVCLVATVTALRRRAWDLLVVSLPAWFMLLFNAAVSVNQVRYNLVLIPPFAIAGALALERLLARRRPRPGSA